MDPARKMDRFYRFQRHVYDATRKLFLVGRDTLLARLDIREGDRVLEVGCGTARNLIVLARHHPGAAFYGLDASRLMLESARAAARRAGVDGRIVLRQGLAEQLDGPRSFGVDFSFEVVFFSYSLSMIPAWQEAIRAALRSLTAGRALYLVDFWDQRDWPRGLRSLMGRWLALFDVRYRPELLDHLARLEAQGIGGLALSSIGRRYAFLARFDKA